MKHDMPALAVAYGHFMARTISLLALILAGGCATHTHTKHTLAHDIGTPIVVAPPPELVVEIDAPKIHVTVARACRAPASDVVVDTLHVTATSANASINGTFNQAEGEVAAIFGIVSALITAVDIAANDGKVTVDREQRPDEEVLCPASVRQVVVEVDLPSGLKLTGRTDDTGIVDLFIPVTEPASGMLTISAPGMMQHTARYTCPAPEPSPE